MMLVGYYSLMSNLDPDLPEVFAAIRATGCRTAVDSAGDGGAMTPLDRILPHTDVYVPSLDEAVHQTGESDPRRILDIYRGCGAPGLLGVKLGSKGALLSPAAGQFVEVAAVQPPGRVVDTTGAGDSFLAGLLTGLLKGMDPVRAGRLAAATGACCVAGYGASAGLRNFRRNRPTCRIVMAGRGQVHVFGQPFVRPIRLFVAKWTSPRPRQRFSVRYFLPNRFRRSPFVRRHGFRILFSLPRRRDGVWFSRGRKLTRIIHQFVGWVKQTKTLVGLRSRQLGLQYYTVSIRVDWFAQPHQRFATSTHPTMNNAGWSANREIAMPRAAATILGLTLIASSIGFNTVRWPIVWRMACPTEEQTRSDESVASSPPAPSEQPFKPAPTRSSEQALPTAAIPMKPVPDAEKTAATSAPRENPASTPARQENPLTPVLQPRASAGSADDDRPDGAVHRLPPVDRNEPPPPADDRSLSNGVHPIYPTTGIE